MSNKEEREQKEMKNLFGDPKTARLAWRSVGAAILQSPCSQRIDVYDKEGSPSLDTQVEQYGYASLKHDLDSSTGLAPTVSRMNVAEAGLCRAWIAWHLNIISSSVGSRLVSPFDNIDKSRLSDA